MVNNGCESMLSVANEFDAATRNITKLHKQVTEVGRWVVGRRSAPAHQQPGDPMQATFDKYVTTGAYHWAEGSPLNWRYNAPLIARYRSVLRRIPAGAT